MTAACMYLVRTGSGWILFDFALLNVRVFAPPARPARRRRIHNAAAPAARPAAPRPSPALRARGGRVYCNFQEELNLPRPAPLSLHGTSTC